MAKYKLISLKHITVVQWDSLISLGVSIKKLLLYLSSDFQICDYIWSGQHINNCILIFII